MAPDALSVQVRGHRQRGHLQGCFLKLYPSFTLRKMQVLVGSAELVVYDQSQHKAKVIKDRMIMALPKIKVAIYKMASLQLNKYKKFKSDSFSEIIVYYDVNTLFGQILDAKEVPGEAGKDIGNKKIIKILTSLEILRPTWVANTQKKVHGAVEGKLVDVDIVLDAKDKITKFYPTMAKIRLYKSGKQSL